MHHAVAGIPFLLGLTGAGFNRAVGWWNPNCMQLIWIRMTSTDWKQFPVYFCKWDVPKVLIHICRDVRRFRNSDGTCPGVDHVVSCLWHLLAALWPGNDLGSNPRFVHTFIDENSMRWVKGTLVFEIFFVYVWPDMVTFYVHVLHLTNSLLSLMRHHGESAYQNTAHLALEMYQIKALQIWFHLWHPFSHTLYCAPSTVFLNIFD